MISDQWWDTFRQWGPEELKHDWYWVIGRVTLFMSPGSRRIPLTTEMVEVAVVYLVFSEIGHISLMLTEEVSRILGPPR